MPESDSPFSEPDFSAIDPVDGDEEYDDTDDELEDEIDDELEDEAEGDAESRDEVADVNFAEPPAPRGAAASVLQHVATSIVDEKEAVSVESKEVRGQTRLYLHVAPGDMGRIIGRRGRTAQAVRTLVRAAAANEGHDVFVEIVD